MGGVNEDGGVVNPWVEYLHGRGNPALLHVSTRKAHRKTLAGHVPYSEVLDTFARLHIPEGLYTKLTDGDSSTSRVVLRRFGEFVTQVAALTEVGPRDVSYGLADGSHLLTGGFNVLFDGTSSMIGIPPDTSSYPFGERTLVFPAGGDTSNGLVPLLAPLGRFVSSNSEGTPQILMFDRILADQSLFFLRLGHYGLRMAKYDASVDNPQTRYIGDVDVVDDFVARVQRIDNEVQFIQAWGEWLWGFLFRAGFAASELEWIRDENIDVPDGLAMVKGAIEEFLDFSKGMDAFKSHPIFGSTRLGDFMELQIHSLSISLKRVKLLIMKGSGGDLTRSDISMAIEQLRGLIDPFLYLGKTYKFETGGTAGVEVRFKGSMPRFNWREHFIYAIGLRLLIDRIMSGVGVMGAASRGRMIIELEWDNADRRLVISLNDATQSSVISRALKADLSYYADRLKPPLAVDVVKDRIVLGPFTTLGLHETEIAGEYGDVSDSAVADDDHVQMVSGYVVVGGYRMSNSSLTDAFGRRFPRRWGRMPPGRKRLAMRNGAVVARAHRIRDPYLASPATMWAALHAAQVGRIMLPMLLVR